MPNPTCHACSQACPIGVRPTTCHGHAYCSTECLLEYFAEQRSAAIDARFRLTWRAVRGDQAAAAQLARLTAREADRRKRAAERRRKRATTRRAALRTPVTPSLAPAIAPAAPQRHPLAA
jgi:hypothetical protein